MMNRSDVESGRNLDGHEPSSDTGKENENNGSDEEMDTDAGVDSPVGEGDLPDPGQITLKAVAPGRAVDHVLLVEAALFSSGKPMSVSDIARNTGLEAWAVKQALKDLRKAYASRRTAMEIARAGDSWCIQLKEEMRQVARGLAEMEVHPRLLRTLAIIAYEQPVAQKWLVDTLGDRAAQHVKELSGMGFIARARRGRGYVLRTTIKFARYFGIDGDDPENIRVQLARRMGVEPPPRRSKLPVNTLKNTGEKLDGTSEGTGAESDDDPGDMLEDENQGAGETSDVPASGTTDADS